MSYREQLRQAREILQGEIRELQVGLASKEMDLRKLDGLLRETGARRGTGPSLTSQIVAILHALAKDSPEGVSARAVVQEFGQTRDDVNESTIRSTLYQVTRKMRPTEITVGDVVQEVRVVKNGPLYDIELVSEQEAELV
ncbi:MAG: hypothetical protein M0R49_01775 [Limnochordia bacterium]|jgi:acetyl-CoA acetyltransferase|nr:hypothetical protein [Limnochordia bacterium]